MLATLAVRVAVLALFPDALAADPDGYRELAKNVVVHGTLGYVHVQSDGSEVCLPSAWRPPLYPLLLAPAELWPWGDLWPIRVLHVALGVLTVCGVLYLLDGFRDWEVTRSSPEPGSPAIRSCSCNRRK